MPLSEDAAPNSEGESPADLSDYLTVAHLTRPRGRRGELTAHLLTDFPENLVEQKELFLWDGKAGPYPVEVEEAWMHGERLILKFAGCDSISEAEELSGLDVLLPRSQAAALPEGMHYIHDLEGCTVVDAGSGDEIGTVTAVEGAPGNFQLQIRTPEGRTVLVPFAEEYCRAIDTGNKRIDYAPPEGLLDLNE